MMALHIPDPKPSNHHTPKQFAVEFTSAPLPSLFDASEIDAEEAADAAAVAAERDSKGGLPGSAKEVAAALVEAIKQQHQRFKANGGLVVTGAQSNGGGAGGGAKAFREVDIHTVTILFPLPAEDPLLHQRKAAELARALGNDQGELLSNVKTFDYDVLKRTGAPCEIIGKTRPELGLHALVKFNSVLGDELGQGVICLPDPGNRIIEMSVDVKLAVGGTLRGKMKAKVMVEQIDFTSALMTEGSRSAATGAGAGVGAGAGGPTAQVVGGSNMV